MFSDLEHNPTTGWNRQFYRPAPYPALAMDLLLYKGKTLPLPWVTNSSPDQAAQSCTTEIGGTTPSDQIKAARVRDKGLGQILYPSPTHWFACWLLFPASFYPL